ncbi:hypothetical protein WM42_1392 [Corynebacterium simulans]|nr:hypothetical protein WM42_1392 [Corynebacterium simulans]
MTIVSRGLVATAVLLPPGDAGFRELKHLSQMKNGAVF